MKKNKNTLIWQVITESCQASYILGTMHVRDERAFRFLNSFYEKIKACDVFATEFDLESAEFSAVEEVMLLPHDQNLKSLLPLKLYEKVDTLLKKQVGGGIASFERMKPIAVTNFLNECVLSKDRLMSLDETLWNFAKDNGKILRGIETFEEQISVLRDLSIDDQVKGLKTVAHNFGKFRKQLLRMTQLYEQADILKIYKSAKQSAKGGRKILLYNRNEIMANRVSEILETQTICVAIGAGHLAGKKGVLRLLKQKGYKIKPISDEKA